MTATPPTRPAKPKRASRGTIRAWAWVMGIVSVAAPWTMFGISPKPAASAATAPRSPAQGATRPVVVVVTKKIVYSRSAPSSSASAPVRYVSASAPSAPAAPVAVSCGTPPC